MSKIKMPKSAPSLDMTPMVDLAFLLVTFFILTANFRQNEAVMVKTPSSHSEKILPQNTMLITVDTGGRVFFSLDGKEVRKNLLLTMGEKYKVSFTEAEVNRFLILPQFGVPMTQLPAYIRGNEKERAAMDRASMGIPMDSVNNQLGDWIAYGWNSKKRWEAENKIPKEDGCRVAIKGDAQTDYKIIKRVIQVFQDRDLNSFQLITDMETEQIQ
ncbi:MAG: biopolymer transporter ExbD [Bacteroidetes bacterium]|nr:biopolymer transporter ExbD [Bacteroidota bacterium]